MSRGCPIYVGLPVAKVVIEGVFLLAKASVASHHLDGLLVAEAPGQGSPCLNTGG